MLCKTGGMQGLGSLLAKKFLVIVFHKLCIHPPPKTNAMTRSTPSFSLLLYKRETGNNNLQMGLLQEYRAHGKHHTNIPAFALSCSCCFIVVYAFPLILPLMQLLLLLCLENCMQDTSCFWFYRKVSCPQTPPIPSTPCSPF